MTRVEVMARLFKRRAGEWLDGRELARAGGYAAWRTRVSELRRPPFSMTIVNRQHRTRTVAGDPVIVSEYRYVPGAITSAQPRRGRAVA